MAKIPNSCLTKPNWLHWLETCPSTNTWAITHLAELSHGDVVFTPCQTAGRGQHGRTWHSPPGVLTASVMLDRCRSIQLPELSLAAGLAVIYAIEDLLPDAQARLRLKWPNDVVVEGQKLAGILCEANVNREMGPVVVGIGLNRCVSFEQVGLAAIAPHVISLHQLSVNVPSERDLLERLRHYLIQAAGLIQYSKAGLTALLPALRERDALLGQTVTIAVGAEQTTGQSLGIGNHGHLQLRLPNGNVRSFASGHIIL